MNQPMDSIPTPEETAALVAELHAAVERSRQARGATTCLERKN